jgi:spore germination protein YaaH
MTYDYHYAGSSVSGPVAPVGGAGKEAEFDVETGIQKALDVLPKSKIVLGVPLYGYEWETIDPSPRSATIPTSGIVISNQRAEELLTTCSSCQKQWDANGQESYIIYEDEKTKTYHHIFYPDQTATKAKVDLATKYDLAGLALWALGYEGNIILNPLSTYKK